MGSSIKEDSIAKISWGILGTMAIGLISGAAYVTKLADATESNTRRIEQVGIQAQEVDDLKTDIAVMKSEVHYIRQMMESKKNER